MKIAVNYYSAVNRGGIGVYTRSLVRALLEADGGSEFHLLCRAGADHRAVERFSNVRLHRISGNRIWFEQVGISRALRGIKPDLLFGPDFTLPLICPCPAVVTIHDLSFIRYPKSISRRAGFLYRTFAPRSVRRADCVVSVSAFTREELSQLGWSNPEKYRTIWSGIRREYLEELRDGDFSRILQKYNLFDEYLLFVGLMEGRKNLQGILEAYRIIHETIKVRDEDPPLLILVGAQGWDFDEIWKKIKSLDMEDWIHYLEYPPDEDLRGLYKGATVFLYPSFYEGFGFPPLEAMAQGAPVVTSNNGAMREIYEGNALLVNPHSPQGIADAAMEILENPERRAELSLKGKEFARRFDWTGVARRYLELFREVADRTV